MCAIYQLEIRVKFPFKSFLAIDAIPSINISIKAIESMNSDFHIEVKSKGGAIIAKIISGRVS